ncbi:MAG: class I tRNA ligase family protein [Nitrososphaeria archaeon]|nr:class I tRNA ligase family protein [Nitrososphaeria archaeon]NIQ33303.1 class I tRNA ligase family protein [Nitrososphaeria archaeon]
MSRKKEVFKPLKGKNVKMFTCGPSIYQRSHIGNYRTFLYEDILHRYLIYLGYEVERVLNFTDIEDKAIAEAEKQDITLEELTSRVADQFLEDARHLKMKPPTYNPRSSTTIDQAVYLIKVLIEKRCAYRGGKDVFFDPLKFKGFGKLYGLDMSRWPKKRRRFRKDTYPGMRWNLGDFILWHGYKKDDVVYWETEIGRGRPAWNIQDAAMATKHLGFQIDIYCGGVDNLYRHHDYTIAVAEAVSDEEFAPYWLHGEHLLVDGEKMSKSKGNVVYLDNLLKEGYSLEHIRFYLIYGHYRKKMNLTKERLQETSKKLDDFKKMVIGLTDKETGVTESNKTAKNLIDSLTHHFEERMNDDLDIKGSFDTLFEIVSKLSLLKREDRLSRDNCQRIVQELRKIDRVLQVIFSNN